jgi:hypothetical protein
MISRRQFLALSNALGISALLPGISTSCTSNSTFKGDMVGAHAALGHRLRTMDFGPVTEKLATDFVIVGGGVAGLSAARYLKRHTNNFHLLEMSEQVGGNAIGSANSISKFPWGAHYLPIPGNTDPELTNFLSEINAITGIKNGLPVYNEYYLCHDPKERLYINNFWQEGIVPHEGIPKKDREEIQRFLELMHQFKISTGNDHKPAFSIPVDFSSRDTTFLKLDLITAAQFLQENNFRSPYLVWYVNYCCADDFGSSLQQTSAWAMIHYFSARNAKAFNATSDAVLTWPEGNHWLVTQLEKTVKENVISNSLVYQVAANEKGVCCTFFDAVENQSKQIQAKAVILATPQFINHRILSNVSREIDYTKFEYAPWMVANISTNYLLNEKKGETLCWDNVIFGSDALGYVNASHQEVSMPGVKKNITYYKPLLNNSVQEARQFAYRSSYSDWQKLVLADLTRPHPEIEKHIEEINIWIWGHGMIRPSPDFVWSKNRRQAQNSIDNKIFFAHSDLSGLSIFEEAFYHGHKAAKLMLSI